jgi:cardiolipin synthase
MNLPNLITILRILLVPITIWLIISSEYGLAFAAFIAAGVSDGVDGFIARRYNQRTELGAYLDPLADKALLVSIYVVLGMIKILPAWLVIMVVTRDVLIIGAVVLARVMGKPVAVAPSKASKVNTVAQICLAMVALASLALQFEASPYLPAGVLLVAILTVGSGALYMQAWFTHMTAGEDP